ncbi:hypothetical protein GC175_19290 [bacterium]|nr:hypothetical protein [bacterium]
MLDIKRQFITDSEGKPVAVILPIQEFALIEDVLEKQIKDRTEDESLALMGEAIHDPLFLADLKESMSAFQIVDIEAWESEQ